MEVGSIRAWAYMHVYMCDHVCVDVGTQGDGTTYSQSTDSRCKCLYLQSNGYLEVLEKEKCDGNSFSICVKARLEEGEAAKAVLVV